MDFFTMKGYLLSTVLHWLVKEKIREIPTKLLDKDFDNFLVRGIKDAFLADIESFLVNNVEEWQPLLRLAVLYGLPWAKEELKQYRKTIVRQCLKDGQCRRSLTKFRTKAVCRAVVTESWSWFGGYVTKLAARKSGKKSTFKSGVKAGAKAVAKTRSRDKTRTRAKTGTKTGAKPGARTWPKTGTKTGAKTWDKTEAKPGTKTWAKTGTKTGTKIGAKTARTGAKTAAKKTGQAVGAGGNIVLGAMTGCAVGGGVGCVVGGAVGLGVWLFGEAAGDYLTDKIFGKEDTSLKVEWTNQLHRFLNEHIPKWTTLIRETVGKHLSEALRSMESLKEFILKKYQDNEEILRTFFKLGMKSAIGAGAQIGAGQTTARIILFIVVADLVQTGLEYVGQEVTTERKEGGWGNVVEAAVVGFAVGGLAGIGVCVAVGGAIWLVEKVLGRLF